MDMYDIKQAVIEYYPFALLLLIVFIPTIIYRLMDNAGYVAPFFISTLSFRTPLQLIIGLVLGVGIGYLFNRGK